MIFGKHWPGRMNNHEIYQAAAPSGTGRSCIISAFISVHPGLCPDRSSPDAQFFNGICLFNCGSAGEHLWVYFDYQNDEKIVTGGVSSSPPGTARFPLLPPGFPSWFLPLLSSTPCLPWFQKLPEFPESQKSARDCGL